MLRFVVAFYFSTYYFSAISKKYGGQHTLRNEHIKDTHLRVVGGRNITDTEYPFAVVLFQFNELYRYGMVRICTASMITVDWVLTAAHCVYDMKAKELFVWYGNYTIRPLKSKMFTKVLDIVIHPGHRTFQAGDSFAFIEDNDISLLRVPGIRLQRYGKLSAVDHMTMVGLPVSYVGGGYTEKKGDDNIRPLQIGEGAIVSCDEDFKEMNKYLICISPKCSENFNRPDEGDSGGPLIYDGKIIGVLSYGQTTSKVTKNGYAPISPYLDWIYEKAKPILGDKPT